MASARSRPGRSRRRLIGLLAIGAMTLVGAGPALGAKSGARTIKVGPTLVTPSSPVTRGSGYVAIGDSVTFGYQEQQVVPAPNYPQPASFPGYPEQLGGALHLTVANFSCPGETSASLINFHAPSNGCENAYRKAYPLHVRYQGAQLAASIAYLRAHPGVRLLSLMIGANDLFRCRADTHDGCASELPAALATVSANVKRILTGVRKQAGYNGQIVILNYYSINYSSAPVSTFSRKLNQAQDSAARPFHVRIADGYGVFRAASTRFGANPCLGGLLTQLGSYGNCGVHPSYAGQTLLAKAVLAATRL